jgi:hypothetical protein
MSIEVKMGRWVTASLAKKLKTPIEALGLTFFVEGVDRESPAWFRTDSTVLRVTGPKHKFGSGTIRYQFEVMVLLTDLVDDTENGFLNHDRLGTIANELCNAVPVFALGDGGAQVGCLDIDRNAKEFLRTVHFGKLDKDTEVVQGAVIAMYEICQDS